MKNNKVQIIHYIFAIYSVKNVCIVLEQFKKRTYFSSQELVYHIRILYHILYMIYNTLEKSFMYVSMQQISFKFRHFTEKNTWFLFLSYDLLMLSLQICPRKSKNNLSNFLLSSKIVFLHEIQLKAAIMEQHYNTVHIKWLPFVLFFKLK